MIQESEPMQNDPKSGRDRQESTTDHEGPSGDLSEYSPSEFNSEVAAEEYHRARQMDVSQGKFAAVNNTRWDHEEVDWSIDCVDSETSLATVDFDGQAAQPDQDERITTPGANSLHTKMDERTHKQSTIIDDHIASIQLKNFKKFRSFRIDSGAINILTGRNNAGKSSILDALRVTHDVLSFSSRRVPEISEFEGKNCACFTLPITALKITIKNITWNYSENPASIRISLMSGTQFVILLHPDHPVRAYLLTEGPVPRTIAAFRRQFPLSLMVVPTLGPVEENEFYLTDKTISSSENTRTAYRHLRNILIRRTEKEFQEFSEEVSSAWPEISLERPKVFGHGEPMEMMFFEDGIPREIFWSGFGLQVWMQMVLQFMRGSENSVLVLDEPDIYLYPELQIRMIDLAARRFGQIFVATHSPTIIGLADSDDVFTISAKESTAIRGLQVKS
jgi:energy-coupling factor transporter ATP-binding protein EcfA2